MKIEQIRGNTGVLSSPGSSIPFYRINEREWILLDCGARYQEKELLKILDQEQVSVLAVIASHAHHDHTSNVNELKRRYGTRLIMSAFDDAVSQNPQTLKSVFYSSTIPEIEQYYGGMVCNADQIVKVGENHITVCGVTFEILNLPGHAASQIGMVTPDGVAYLADSIFSEELLKAQSMIYTFHWKDALKTLESIKELFYMDYVLAHSGVYHEIDTLVQTNQQYLSQFMQRIRAVYQSEFPSESFTMEMFLSRALSALHIQTKNIVKAQMIERMLRSVLEYYLEDGELCACVRNGIQAYRLVND